MVKAASLCLESLYGIKHRYFNVVVADDNPEVAGLFPIEVRLFRLGSQHLLLTPALLRRLVPFVQPMVMGGFEVYRADILSIMDVLFALLQQADGIAPQAVVGRAVVVAGADSGGRGHDSVRHWLDSAPEMEPRA